MAEENKLSFCDRQLKLNTEEDGEKVAQEIEAFPYLEILELRGNTLGVDATRPIARALTKHPELKRALWSDLFTSRLNTEIPRTLKILSEAMQAAGTRLVELDLSDNAIGPQAIAGIQEFLASEACFGLQELRINNCGMGVAGITVADSLRSCHAKSLAAGTPFRLRTFIAGRNRLEFRGAKALSEAFATIGTLEEIALPQNGIKSDGIAELAKAVKANPKLRVLNLNDNTFRSEGAIAMAKAIVGLDAIECIDFGDCLCRRKGSLAIGRALARSNSPIQVLNLSGNEIDYETAKQLIDVARELPALRRLILNTNNFGSEFDTLAELSDELPLLDVGTESDDGGSLDEESDEEEELEFEEDELRGPAETVGPTASQKEPVGLGKLSFEGRQLKLNNEADGQQIANQIDQLARLEVLELRGNTLGVDASRPIARALERRPELKHALWSDMFTGRLNTEIPITLKTLCDAMQLAGTRLVELDLSDNAIGPQAIAGIQGFLCSDACFGLQELRINNCGMGVAGVTVAASLKECHAKSLAAGTPFRLKTFIAGRNRLELRGSKALAEAFAIIGTLEEIAMPQNGIRADGIAELAKAAKSNPHLRILNLNDNTFGDRGAIAMSRAVGTLPVIEHIDFGDCLCRRKGSLAICRALAEAKSVVQVLNLSGNEIDYETGMEIVELIRRLPRIQKLILNTNNFGSDFNSIAELCDSLPILDLGEESDDAGSLDSEDESDEDEVSEQEEDQSVPKTSPAKAVFDINAACKDAKNSFLEQMSALQLGAKGDARRGEKGKEPTSVENERTSDNNVETIIQDFIRRKNQHSLDALLRNEAPVVRQLLNDAGKKKPAELTASTLHALGAILEADPSDKRPVDFAVKLVQALGDSREPSAEYQLVMDLLRVSGLAKTSNTQTSAHPYGVLLLLAALIRHNVLLRYRGTFNDAANRYALQASKAGDMRDLSMAFGSFLTCD